MLFFFPPLPFSPPLLVGQLRREDSGADLFFFFPSLFPLWFLPPRFISPPARVMWKKCAGLPLFPPPPFLSSPQQEERMLCGGFSPSPPFPPYRSFFRRHGFFQRRGATFFFLPFLPEGIAFSFPPPLRIPRSPLVNPKNGRPFFFPPFSSSPPSKK